MKSLVISIFILFSLNSCISNKELVYLQNKDSKETTITISKDSFQPYKVQTNDILSIDLKAIDQSMVEMFSINAGGGVTSPEQFYFKGYTVNDHGNIRVPVLGEINVLGYTLDEIRILIEKRLLDEYFTAESRLFVTVKLAGLRYTINGEIGSTGTKTLFQDRVNIMEAIANSGDITVTGNRKKVQVIRQFPYGMESYYLDLTSADAVNSPAFYLQPNDYIYIKPLKQKSWGTGVTGVQSVATIITALSLITTTYLLTKSL